MAIEDILEGVTSCRCEEEEDGTYTCKVKAGVTKEKKVDGIKKVLYKGGINVGRVSGGPDWIDAHFRQENLIAQRVDDILEVNPPEHKA